MQSLSALRRARGDHRLPGLEDATLEESLGAEPRLADQVSRLSARLRVDRCQGRLHFQQRPDAGGASGGGCESQVVGAPGKFLVVERNEDGPILVYYAT
jgi:hypothetical protein